MIVNIVTVTIKPEHRDAFEEVTKYNHENSRREEGNIRFDVLHCTGEGESDKYILYEVFRDLEAVEFHKTTEHYKRWAKEMETYGAAPRSRTGCVPIAFD